MYVLGRKLSLVRLCDSDFGINPVDDITIGITCAAFCFHIAHISFAKYYYYYYYSIVQGSFTQNVQDIIVSSLAHIEASQYELFRSQHD